MNAAMRPQEDEYEEAYEAYHRGGPGGFRPPPPFPPQPVAPVPPRYCCKHDSSEKRMKAEPTMRECTSCHVQLQTSYVDFCLCPHCSEKQQRCMLCGDSAPNSGSYIP